MNLFLIEIIYKSRLTSLSFGHLICEQFSKPVSKYAKKSSEGNYRRSSMNDFHDINSFINYQSDNLSQGLNLTWFIVAIVYSVVIWIFCRSVRRYTTTSI